MDRKIVQTSDYVTLVGAGPANTGNLDFALTFAPRIVAVDGGTEMLRNCGMRPDAVIGDMDSTPAAALAGMPPGRVHRIVDQHSTDFDKALAAVSAPLIVGVGFLGGRADHQMAALNSLARHDAGPVILLGEDDVVFRVPDYVAIDVDPGTRISLHPLTAARVDGTGLRWPLNDVALAADGLISQSNEATAARVELRCMGALLAFLPRQALGAAVAALTRSRQTT